MRNLITKISLALRVHWRDLYISCKRGSLNSVLSSLIDERPNPCSSKSILVEALWENPVQYLRIHIALNALRQTAELEIIGLLDKEKIFLKRSTLRALGVKNLVTVRLSRGSRYKTLAQEIVNELSTCEDLLRMKIFNGYPGHYLYDAILKEEGVGSLAAYHPGQIKRYIYDWVGYVRFYEELFDRNDFDEVIISHLVTIRFSSLAWVALRRGISVTLLNYRNAHITAVKVAAPSALGKFNEDVLDFGSFFHQVDKCQQVVINEGRLFARAMEGGRTGEISLFKCEESTRSEPLVNILAAAEGRRIVSIFASCWPDFPNLRGPCWFDNFEDFTNRFAKYAQNRSNYFFVFRAHPAEAKYSKRTTLNKVIAPYLKFENIAVCPSGVAAEALIDVSDLLISPQGSIAYEQTARGKKVVLGRDTDFTDWNICAYAKDEKELFGLVDQLHDITEPTIKQIDFSHAYLALWQGSPDQDRRFCKLPWGRYGQQLWISLPGYIRQSETQIINETLALKHWFSSDRRYGFNTTKWIEFMQKGANESVN